MRFALALRSRNLPGFGLGIDSFTEVSSQGWFSRIGGSIKGILVGIVVVDLIVFLVKKMSGAKQALAA